MLSLDAIRLEHLPFEGLNLANELLDFEGNPILMHYNDAKKQDVLAYWVDYGEQKNRWLYWKVLKHELYYYINGTNSLKTLLLNAYLGTDFIFFADVNFDDSVADVWLTNADAIPDKYLPKDESFYTNGVSAYYEEYLFKFNYIEKLRESSYIFKVEPADGSHANTVGAKEAALVLEKATDSIEAYIEVSAFHKLKDQTSDSKRITRRINKLKKHFTPRISQAVMNSFEVWLAIDTLTFNTSEDNADRELRQELIDGYKNDVLDVDYSSEEDARAISGKFTPEERERIYKPLIKLFDNDNLQITISDSKNTISINKRRVKLKNSFKDIVLPPPSLEEVQTALERKTKIIAIVLNIKEGEDISNIKKRDLVDNLLFKEEWAESPFEISSPIEASNGSVTTKRPLRCTIKIDGNGNFQITNQKLELFAEGGQLAEVTAEISRQFVELALKFLGGDEGLDPRFVEELKSYI